MSTFTGSVKAIVVLLLLNVVCLSLGQNSNLLDRCKYKYGHRYPGCSKCCQDSRRDCKAYCKTCSYGDCRIRLGPVKYMDYFRGRHCHTKCNISTITGRGLINNDASFFSKRTPKYQVQYEPHFHDMNELNQGQVLSDTTDTEY